MEKTINREIGRQIIHLIIGLAVVASLLLFGQTITAILLSTILLVGTLIINWKMLGSKVPVADWFHERFERKAQRFPGYGSAWYIVGLMFLTLFSKDASTAAAIAFILASGDAFSTIIGLHGKRKLNYNKKKTFEGTVAFIVFSLPAYFIIGPNIIPLAVFAAVVEGLPFSYDDNITIPIACVFLSYLI